MKHFLNTLTLSALIAAPSAAFAHDQKFHKGAMIEGKLSSIHNDRAAVQAEKGEVTILISPDTTVEIGQEGKHGVFGDLKDGQRVAVHGHKLETGEMAATDIMVQDAESGGNTK